MPDAVDIRISPAFAAAGVSVRLGCLEADVRVRSDDPDTAAALERAVAAQATALAGRPVAELPAVAEARGAFRRLGKDPSRYRPSSEALLRRAAQGKGLFRVSNVVDTNNLVSLETGLPSGTYDLDRLEVPLELRVGAAGAGYEAIARGAFNLESLPVLCDGRGPFGSPTSDSVRSMVTEGTRRLLLVLYAFGAAPGLDAACAAAAEGLRNYCQGEILHSRIVEARSLSE